MSRDKEGTLFSFGLKKMKKLFLKKKKEKGKGKAGKGTDDSLVSSSH